MSIPSCAPSPTDIAFVRATSSSSSGPAASPTGTSTLPARHRSPAAPNAEPMIASTAFGISASAITIRWFLAPPSACTRLPSAAAVA